MSTYDSVSLTTTAVPEPYSLTAITLGSIGFTVARSRRKKHVPLED
ncbi:PEP-CTERM sorting domain-containing protein [Rhodopirellula europaea]